MSSYKSSPLPPEVEAIFERIVKLFDSDDEQNKLYPEPIRSTIIQGLSCDELPGGKGDFGRTPSNPIPTNGPLGQVIYLSKLRTVGPRNWLGLRTRGSPVMFHRVWSEEGPTGPVDAYKVRSLDGAVEEVLYLSMYHPRKSKKSPSGYILEPKLDSDNWLYGVNHAVPNFPQKLDAYIRKWQMEMLGVPLPVSRVRKAINGSEFRISTLDERENRREARVAILQNDVLHLLNASQEPRFAGKRLFIGRDGLVRAGQRADARHSYAQEQAESRIPQHHNYDGSKPIEEWREIRLRLVCVQSAEAVRRRVKALGVEARDLGVSLVPDYWHECIYFTYFLVTLCLMKEKFCGDPTYWADKCVMATLSNLLAERQEDEASPEITLKEAIARYRQRYAAYWKCLAAFTKEAPLHELERYGLLLTRNFTGKENLIVAPLFLVLSNEILAIIASSIQRLSLVRES